MKQYINIVEEQLASYNFGAQPTELYEPILYILSLGGKRLRPVLTLMSCQLFDEAFDKAIFPALGIEVFHNFTLLHDDIMDNAPIRRGKQTVHEKWNSNVAILSGDVMLVKAYDLFLNYNGVDLNKILQEFNKTATEVCEGQQYDMNFEIRDDVTEEEYIEMIRLKTAVLLACALKIGAIAGGADDKSADKLYDFGINVGLGFQLKDDLLDVYADKNKFGKQVGGDIISNKKTYLLIKALELASGKIKNELINWLNKETFDAEEKVKAVTEIYDRLGIKELTERKMNTYFEKGIDIFNGLNIDEQKKAPLMEVVTKLIDREK